VNEIDDLASGVGTTSGCAKVGSAAEGPTCINLATARRAVEKGASAIGAFWETSAARGLPSLGRHKCFPFREIRSFSRDLKVATFCAGGAGTGYRALGELRINSLHLGEGDLGEIRLLWALHFQAT